MEKLLDDLQENDQSQEWYSIVQNIQKRFKDRYKIWHISDGTKYVKINTCIICQKKPNCLNIYNLSKKEIEKMIF